MPCLGFAPRVSALSVAAQAKQSRFSSFLPSGHEVASVVGSPHFIHNNSAADVARLLKLQQDADGLNVDIELPLPLGLHGEKSAIVWAEIDPVLFVYRQSPQIGRPKVFIYICMCIYI